MILNLFKRVLENHSQYFHELDFNLTNYITRILLETYLHY